MIIQYFTQRLCRVQILLESFTTPEEAKDDEELLRQLRLVDDHAPPVKRGTIQQYMKGNPKAKKANPGSVNNRSESESD